VIEGIVKETSGRAPDAYPTGLRSFSVPARLAVTLFLVGLALGVVAGQANVWFTHGDADGQPGLTVNDLERAFHGRPGWTLLASKIDGGSMERHIPIPSERKTVLDWANSGASLEGFTDVRPVLQRRCVKCHAPGKEKADRPFADSAEAGPVFEKVKLYTQPDRGMSNAALATSTHAHLFGFSLLFLALGLIFCMTNTTKRTKIILVSLPFIGVFLDIGSWWAAKWDRAFVYVIIAGGAIMVIGVVASATRSLWEMWGPRDEGLRV
jgi:hypothetical protein